MKQIDVSYFADNLIICNNADDIDLIMSILNDGENFIVNWQEDHEERSRLMLATNLLGKVRNAEVTIMASKTVVKE